MFNHQHPSHNVATFKSLPFLCRPAEKGERRGREYSHANCVLHFLCGSLPSHFLPFSFQNLREMRPDPTLMSPLAEPSSTALFSRSTISIPPPQLPIKRGDPIDSRLKDWMSPRDPPFCLGPGQESKTGRGLIPKVPGVPPRGLSFPFQAHNFPRSPV